jgi:hypothetical protein
MREMANGAVLCTNCGYDTRSGKSVAKSVAAVAPGTKYDPAKAAATEAALKKAKNKVADAMAPQKSYFRGLAGCVGGAFIGATVWFLVAWGTGYELYILVLGVAALAGLGMQWGQQGYSTLGGITAAGVTFVTMILARLAVVLALIVPMMRADFEKEQAAEAEEAALRIPDLSDYDERVVDTLVEDHVKANKLDLDNERQEAAAYQAVEKKLKAMPKTQYDAMVAKFEHEEAMAQLEDYMVEEILKKDHNIHPDAAGSVQWDQATKSAQERLAKMTQPQKDAEYKRLHAEDAKREAQALAARQAERAARKARGEDPDADGISSGAVFAVGAIVIFFLVFGGIKGMICTLIALGLAYRTASGAVSSS